MLQFPLPTVGINEACNFSIAEVLLAHISGIAIVFFDSTATPRDRFVGLLKAHYPWSAEAHHVYNTINSDSGSNILYDLFEIHLHIHSAWTPKS